MKRQTIAPVARVLLIAALLGGSAAAAPAEAASSWGRASAPDQTIKAGCHDYRFHYDVTAPGDEWMAELTLVNPNGRKVSSHMFESGAEQRSDTSAFELCKDTTIPGRYLITMKVTSYDGRAVSARRVEPAAFRLTARR